MKRITGLVIACMLLAQIMGCSVPEKPEADEEVAAPDLVAEDTVDAQERERIWKEYIFPAISTVMNTREFQSAEEIDPNAVARFCWWKYVEEHGVEQLEETLERVDEQSRSRLFPLDIAMPYAYRYFNLESLDLSRMNDSNYDSQREAFTFSLGKQPRVSNSYGKTAGGLSLHEMEKNPDGTLIVTLYDYYSGDIVDQIATITLMQHEDGEFFFGNGKKEYVENRLVDIVGEHQEFSFPDVFNTSEPMKMISEQGSAVIINTGDHKMPLIKVETNQMKIVRQLELEEESRFIRAKEKDGRIYLMLDDRVRILDMDLKPLQEIPLPPALTREGTQDFFGGYDVCADLERFVYADGEGLKLLDSVDMREELLAGSIHHEHQNVGDFTSHYFDPCFVSGEQKVLATRSYYEGNDGYHLFDLIEGTSKEIQSFEAISTSMVYFDDGAVVDFHTPEYFEDLKTNNYRISYLDFPSGEVNVAESEILGGYMGYIIFPSEVYSGKRYSAFLTIDSETQARYVNRISNESMETEGNLLSLENARVHLVGVLEDGCIMVYYYRNPVDNGFCLIPETGL